MCCYENDLCWPIDLVCCFGSGSCYAIGFVAGTGFRIGSTLCIEFVHVAVDLLSASVSGTDVVIVVTGLWMVYGLWVGHSGWREIDIVVALLLVCSACFA